MPATDDCPQFEPGIEQVIVRAANEGIPIGAIARLSRCPYEDVTMALQDAKARGEIVTLPRADWPPGGSNENRLPTIPRTVAPTDMEFAVKSLFKLTNLEAGFVAVLLKHTTVEKEKLHNVIEQQRANRQLRPDKQEQTDPKMVDVMICKLRKKLKAVAPELLIKTNWGSGYFLEQSVKDAIWKLSADFLTGATTKL